MYDNAHAMSQEEVFVLTAAYKDDTLCGPVSYADYVLDCDNATHHRYPSLHQSTIYIKPELLCGEAGSEVERNFSPALASRHVYLEGAVPSIPRAGH